MFSSFPPLRNLPSWSRVGILDSTCYPPLCPSHCVPGDPVSDRPEQSRPGMDGARVASLEKDILFLQQTHQNTLERLHEEIECLKRTNKELQYQLIMDSPQHTAPQSSAEDSHEKPPQPGVISSEEKLETANHKAGGHYRGTITSLLPLKIRNGQSLPPRTPTLQECEAIIQQLYKTNALQYQELLRVKATLTDVLNKKKTPPEVCSLTKASVSDSTSGEFQHFPKLPLKPLPKLRQSSQACVREKLILPAIRQSLHSGMTERQKRAQDGHKTRLRRVMNS